MSLNGIEHRSEIESHVESHLIPVEVGHTNAYENSAKQGLPMIAVSPVLGRFTSLLTTAIGASNVLEIGTLGGYSSMWFAQAVQGKGKVTSIEIDAHRRDVAIDNLRFAGLNVPEDVDVILGAGLDILPKLELEIQAGKRERFDFVFIDADRGNQWNYFDWGVKLSEKGSVVYVDNAVKGMLESGIVGSQERDSQTIDLVAEVGKDERVDSVVMQTVGAKGYDGFLLAVVK
ncbi:hypothetical protein N7462_009771 [Penicillium macrosclerotiorum]|uniref:uncharacterized protein n=1 Tax=Penicillium macrosclerotiorum TaxID=303699 RepID=UPI0025499829|nr:uncharacterized protein N7462_009771 [Penicillium macrosclerotiorum]KAJ5668701.1 hypothetical protein N7462_009771 [Penicillium macrosclerotiorum]